MPEPLAPSTQLRRLADRLHILISAPRDVLPEARLREVLVHDLDALHQVLLKHFAAEEEGGYLKSLREAKPELEADTLALLREHTTLAEDFQQLLADAPTIKLSDLLERIATVLENFDAHEHAEAKLLLQASA